MKREYHPLGAHRLQTGARYHQPGQDLERVRIDSPALAIMTDLVQSEGSHVVATLKCSGRQHALVIDASSDGEVQTVRGIFSASQLARQLGVAIQTTEVAQTFAEIGAALGH